MAGGTQIGVGSPCLGPGMPGCVSSPVCGRPAANAKVPPGETGPAGGAEIEPAGGAEIGPVAVGVSEADPSGGTSSASAPSATGSSGCSSTVGAIPSWLCSIRATSGSRDEPPTRNSPVSCSGRSPQRWITAAVSCTARCTSGVAIRSNSSRVRCTASSIPGTATGATGVRDSISLAPRTSSQNSRRLRASDRFAGRSSLDQLSAEVVSSSRPRCATSSASTSSPPRSSTPPSPSTSKPAPELRTTATSSVPPPKSKTPMQLPTGTGRRSTSAK